MMISSKEAGAKRGGGRERCEEDTTAIYRASKRRRNPSEPCDTTAEAYIGLLLIASQPCGPFFEFPLVSYGVHGVQSGIHLFFRIPLALVPASSDSSARVKQYPYSVYEGERTTLIVSASSPVPSSNNVIKWMDGQLAWPPNRAGFPRDVDQVDGQTDMLQVLCTLYTEYHCRHLPGMRIQSSRLP